MTHTELDPKVVATLQARAVLAGWQLTHLPDDSFVISRWGQSRELAHAADVERFLKRVRPGGSGG